MGFSVKKSMVFLVAIVVVLLLCRCSCADDDHFPHVRAGDRKLLFLAKAASKVFRPLTGKGSKAGSTWDPHPPKFQSHSPTWIPRFGVENTREFIATKLYGGGDGLRSFKIGWKAGKRIYSIEKRCQDLQDELAAAASTEYPPCYQDCNSTFCVTTIIEKTLDVDGWSGSSHQLPETPCTYLNGSIYDRYNRPVFSNNTRITC